MKRIALLISFCFGVTSAFAQLIGDEPFPYTSGSALIGQGNWIDAGSGGAAAGPAIGSGGLSYSGLLTSGGTDAQFGAGTENTRMNLTGGGTGAYAGGSTLSVYFSYVLQLSSAASTGPFELTALDQKATATAIGSRGAAVMVEDNGLGTGFFIGFIRGGQNGTTLANSSVIKWIGGDDGSGGVSGSTTLFSYNTPLFIVGDYNFIDPPKNPTSSDNDTADFWVNPDSSTFGASAPSADLSGVTDGGHAATDLANIASFDLIQNDSFGNAAPTGIIDDVRVGYTWADVTPAAVPEPSVLAFGYWVCARFLCGAFGGSNLNTRHFSSKAQPIIAGLSLAFLRSSARGRIVPANRSNLKPKSMPHWSGCGFGLSMQSLLLVIALCFGAHRTTASLSFDPFADARADGGTSYGVGSFLFGQVNGLGRTRYALTNTPAPPATGFPVVVTFSQLRVSGKPSLSKQYEKPKD